MTFNSNLWLLTAGIDQLGHGSPADVVIKKLTKGHVHEGDGRTGPVGVPEEGSTDQPGAGQGTAVTGHTWLADTWNGGRRPVIY